ncbi:MAG: CENP-V/GFA domain-containing protein [Serratia liquefaciens]|jgi:hypothetical protein
MPTDEINLEDALDFDLFQGDFGTPGDSCLSDKIVKCRKVHACHICAGNIEPGEIARSSTWKFDGELHSYYCCDPCVKAMVISVNCDYEDEDPIDARYAIGEIAKSDRKSGHG